MTTFRVLMLGYQRVGKTSLLASMYRATQKELAGNYQFQIKHGNDLTSQLLSKAEDNLKCATEYIFGDAIAPTNVLRTFLFQMYSNEQMLFQVEFLDYQGGRLMDSSTSDAATVREWLNTCVAVIIPIDSPSLMESEGEWAKLIDEWNNPEGIENIFRSEMNRNTPRLVILSPVKCEKYIQ
ncbi:MULTISPECIES: hypothetical protein [Calothrix]|uniref:Uncharacterized protein n=2 Tax=Calothrix TaxID=1186 RepID=A0ABR8ALK1_9CYAN|nr:MULTISPECIES: hypothetical protein [Calothrix]MBD2199522.1 hypothetical protein [Calothrix parietina FACHB-288]MBD2228325.1 hypothetical protein [Calothrix anomala FACHB-343]